MSFHRLLPSISFLKSDRRIAAGSPHPLGATWDGRGTNFALFSIDRREGRALPVRQERAAARSTASCCRSAPKTSGTATCPTRSRASSTATASTAPTIPRPATASIANKLLIDPYSKRLGGQFAWTDAHLAYRVGNKREDLSFDRRDNARSMLKSVVVDQAHTWSDDRHPQVPWEDTIIYEAHVKGLTQTARGRPEGIARHLPRAGGAGDDRASAQARRHRDRAAADPFLRRRAASARATA